jgi:hypothetical protein
MPTHFGVEENHTAFSTDHRAWVVYQQHAGNSPSIHRGSHTHRRVLNHGGGAASHPVLLPTG